MDHYSATYSPEDNKLRLYSISRLPKETYERVRARGFIWAPKQELFVAPMWTPDREDLLIELCGEIGDEDTSLVDRAEQRAERFEEYSEKRAEDADRAHAAVHAITEHIPLGQPILVGHHSERHARKDAERIENGMRKAVQMWDTSKYWTSRAAGALRHAKYKELPAVRYRRIKGLEADKRKQEKNKTEAEKALRIWATIEAMEDATEQRRAAYRFACYPEGRLYLPKKEGDRGDYCTAYDVLRERDEPSDYYQPRTMQEIFDTARVNYPNQIAYADRWIQHYENRIAYERAMLDEQGGIKGESFEYAIGGRILRRGEWLPIVKINKRGGVVQSVTVLGHFASTVSVDEIRDYRPPAEGDAEKVKAVTDKGPMCNYPGEGFKHMTTAEWKRHKMSDVPQAITHKATETHARHRTRATAAGGWSTVAVYLTDSKRIDPPSPPLITPEPVKFERMRELPAELPQRTERAEDPNAAKFEALKDTLKAGVQVVSAPQLFPTPPELAARMVQIANIAGPHPYRILEPSAGTGAIIDAIPDNVTVHCVEINNALCRRLHTMPKVYNLVEGDFLEQNGNLGKFDAVLMNPPFANGADVKHITHALNFLKPGGRLVAICANGPRQNEQLRPMVEGYGGTWERLPDGTFKEQGTNVNTVLLSLTTPTE